MPDGIRTPTRSAARYPARRAASELVHRGAKGRVAEDRLTVSIAGAAENALAVAPKMSIRVRGSGAGGRRKWPGVSPARARWGGGP